MKKLELTFTLQNFQACSSEESEIAYSSDASISRTPKLLLNTQAALQHPIADKQDAEEDDEVDEQDDEGDWGLGKFLAKYYSPSKTLRMKNEITQFRQFDQEPWYEACERFIDLIRKCPGYVFETDQQELTTQMSTMAKAITLLTKNSLPTPKIASDHVDAVHDSLENVNYMQGCSYNNNFKQNQGGNQYGQRDRLSYANPNNFQQPPLEFSTTNGVINEGNKPDLEDILDSFMQATK
ncbi:hypothetical protein C2S51_008892 [Perilla frutescens var. frutescens]|nr:hypothetical protein C2S51_008892 [Perilla frutescens var. frutescens]